MKRFIFWFLLGSIHGVLMYYATVIFPDISIHKLAAAFTIILIAESIFFEKIFKHKKVQKSRYVPKHIVEQSR